MSFSQPGWLALVPVILLLAWRGRRLYHLPLSSVKFVPKSRWTRYVAAAPAVCLVGALILGAIAMAGPRMVQDEAQGIVKGRDITVAMDISGSMSNPIAGWSHPETGKNRRIDAAQYAFRQFVLNREALGDGDRIGLILFDDAPRLSWPLTHEMKQLHRKADFLPIGLGGPGGLGGGTNFGQKGAGPIDEAAKHFEEFGQSPSRVIVLITDGENTLDDKARKRLVALVKRLKARLYVIGVGPTLATEEVDIMKVTREVDGRVFRVETGGQLEQCFEEISKLESGPIQVGYSNVFLELFIYPAVLATVAIFLWLALAALMVIL